MVKEKYYCLNPLTVYGQTKLKCEKYGEKYDGENLDFRCIRFPGIISATSIPTGGTSDYAPEMIHAAAQGKQYDCFVNNIIKIPFIVMPDAIDAMIKIMQVPKNQLRQDLYNITSFNPTAAEFYEETKKYFHNFVLRYSIDTKREKIVNSWPDNIDDSSAREEWGWEPKYNLNNIINEYLIKGKSN